MPVDFFRRHVAMCRSCCYRVNTGTCIRVHEHCACVSVSLGHAATNWTCAAQAAAACLQLSRG